MTNTENLNLNLIEEHDLLDFAIFNENANILDTVVGGMQEETDKIPTIESAVSTLNEDMTTVENGITSLNNSVSDINEDLGDINTVVTNHGLKITALENTAEKFFLNGVQLETNACKSFIVTDVQAVSDLYGNYRYIVNIPMSNFPNATNVKVVSALLYNDGLTIYGYALGANLVRAVVRNNNIECVFVSNQNFTADGATAVITAIGY